MPLQKPNGPGAFVWMLAIATGLFSSVAVAQTALQSAASKLAPGQWVEFQTTGFNSTNFSYPSGRPAVSYAESLKWDPVAREMHFVGGGHYEDTKHVVYSEATNAWTTRPLPSFFGLPNHGYDHIAIDANARILYHRQFNSGTIEKYNLDSKTWSRGASFQSVMDGMQVAGGIEWFPELGRVVYVDGDFGVALYNPANNTWSKASGRLAGLGSYHNFAEYSPTHKVVVFGGGDSSRALYRMNASGTITRMKDAPVPLGVMNTLFVLEPVGGNFIVFYGNGGAEGAYEYDPSTDSWASLPKPPFFQVGGEPGVIDAIAGYIPAYGVIMVGKYNGNQSKVFLYKHKAGSGVTQPSISLSANPTTVNAQGSTTLTWSTTNADACTASGGSWTGSKPLSGSETVGPIASNTTYRLSCTNEAGGSSSRSVTVTVAAATPPPTVSLNANPTSVAVGGTATLDWTSTNATSCTASGNWSGNKATTGSQNVGPLSANATYTLTCTGAGGSASDTATVTVTQSAPTPTLQLTANPTSVTSGGSSTLSWTAQHATSCTASGGWSGSRPTSGSASTGPLTSTRQFTLTCTGEGGSVEKSVTVQVNATAPAPTVSLSSSASSVPAGGTAVLTWSSTNASSCSASGAWSGSRATSGQETIGPLQTSGTYTLTCQGQGGSATHSVTVNVTADSTESPEEGGGGAFGGLSLLALAGAGLARLARRRLRGAAGVALLAVPLAAGAQTDPLSDFKARASAPGVIRAVGFDTQAEVFQNVHPDGAFEKSGSGWDQNVKASGAGSLRFNIPGNSGSGVGGSWRINFTDDLSVQFDEGGEFYIQWRQRFDTNMVTTNYQGSGGFKQIIIGEGDTPTREANSCTETEVVVQNTDQRGFPQMYHSCVSFMPFEELVNGYDFKLQNAIPAPYCLYSEQKSNQIIGNPPCFIYRANEWLTFQVRIKLGPRGTARSAIEPGNITGFTNSIVQMWAAREGQPSVLIHDWSGIVLRETAGKKYGKVWLLPYMTNKSSSQAHPTGYTWYDELIISRQRIPDPGAPPSPSGPFVEMSASPSSVNAQGSSTLTWSASNATSCTASGGWSGTKATSGSEVVGPIAKTTTYTLTCTNGSQQHSASATVQVVGSTPAPTVDLTANPATVASGDSTTLSWTSSNATSCNASGGVAGWAGSRPTSGSRTVGPIVSDTQFTLTCTGPGGSTSDSVTVRLAATPTVSLQASPTTVTSGERTQLTWSSQNATSCTASGAWAGNKPTSGTEQSAALSQTSTFTLTCTGPGGTGSNGVTVNVNAPQTSPPPPPEEPGPGGEEGGKGSLGMGLLAVLALARLRRFLRARVQLAA